MAKKQTKITEEDLKFIYGKDYKLFQDKILPNCFCGFCVKNGSHTVKIVNYEIFLNHLNDIELQGFCANCGGRKNGVSSIFNKKSNPGSTEY